MILSYYLFDKLVDDCNRERNFRCLRFKRLLWSSEFFHILRIHGLLAKKGNKPVKSVKYQRGGGGGLPGGGGGGLKPGEGGMVPLLPLAGGASVIRPETGTRWPLAYMH